MIAKIEAMWICFKCGKRKVIKYKTQNIIENILIPRPEGWAIGLSECYCKDCYTKATQ